MRSQPSDLMCELYLTQHCSLSEYRAKLRISLPSSKNLPQPDWFCPSWSSSLPDCTSSYPRITWSHLSVCLLKSNEITAINISHCLHPCLLVFIYVYCAGCKGAISDWKTGNTRCLLFNMKYQVHSMESEKKNNKCQTTFNGSAIKPSQYTRLRISWVYYMAS